MGISIPSKKKSQSSKSTTQEKTKSLKELAKTLEKKESETVEVKKTTTQKRATRKKTKLDIDKLVDDVYEQLDAVFSLTSYLQLPPEKAREIIKDIVELVAGSYSSKPTGDMIIKRIKRYANVFNEYIASKILSEIDHLTPNMIEFIITRGGKAALSDVSKLYKLAVNMNRDDLVAALRTTWNTYGAKGMIMCPHCGFNAVSPDRMCIVCGEVVSEDYVRKTLGFDDKFEVFLKTASVAELNEVLNYGYVLLGERGVYNPRSRRARIENPVVYTIYLTNAERSRIVEEVGSRDMPI